MSRYINREEALSFPFANGQYDHKNADENFILGCESYKEWLENLPTADVIYVVRCKDCKWWDKVDNIDGVNYGTCERKCTAIRKDAFPNENWFCADGEKVTE